MRICRLLCWLLLGAVTVSVPCLACATDRLPPAQIDEAGNDVLSHLQHIDEFLRSGQWEEAVESMRRIMETRGDRLLRVTPADSAEVGRHERFVPVRVFCQMQLATWHAQAPAALATYRRGVDATAAQWLETAAQLRDEQLLTRLVDELLLSSVGDQALLLFGDMALQRGSASLARRSWEAISPRMRVTPAAARVLGCAPGISWWHALAGRDLPAVWPRLAAALGEPPQPIDWLACPDTDIPLSQIWARLCLASLLEGARERAELEWELLRRLHPEAVGVLGGSEGRLAELVAAVLDDARQWSFPNPGGGWSTFAGRLDRGGAAPAEVDVAGGPSWRAALARVAEPARATAWPPPVAEDRDGLLSYHVAVRDGIVYVCQQDAIRAFDIRTGRPAWPTASGVEGATDPRYGTIFELPAPWRDPFPPATVRTGVPRFSVTLDRQRLFARLGPTWSGGQRQWGQRDEDRSCLVALDLKTQKLLIDRIGPGEPGWEFEGAPVSDGSRLYASQRRRDASTVQVRIVCYALESGRQVWERLVARAEAVEPGLLELSNSLLSVHDDILFYHGNVGVVMAVRASDGSCLWLSRYERTGPAGKQAFRNERYRARDMTPCLIADSLAVVAAADCDRLLALDTTSGKVIWTTAAEVAADAVHLLGVAGSCLLASGNHLYWLDARTGALRGQFPPPGTAEPGFADPDPCGYGRGVLAGSSVYWPTRTRILVFDQQTPRLVRQPIDLAAMGVPSGHLVIDHGVMLIASASELVALAEHAPREQPAVGTRRIDDDDGVRPEDSIPNLVDKL